MRLNHAFSQQLAEQGIYERIIVRPIPNSEQYEILAGHSRTEAWWQARADEEMRRAAPARLGYDVKLSEIAQSNLSADGTSDAATVQETAEHFGAAAVKQDIIDRTNALRRENGVSALTVNGELMQAAQVRAEEMAASGVYSHTRPDR